MTRTHSLNVFKIVLAGLVLLAALLAFAPSAKAAPIPAGCPGSTLQGPPAPGVCEAIPVGCPGSKLQGPPAPGVTCPYGTSDSEDSAPVGSKIERNDKGFDEGCAEGDESDGCNIVGKYVNPLINFLTGLVGVVVAIMIIVGGIQYSSAGGDPGKVAAAKSRITNALLAIVAYIFLFAFLQWIVPGGI